MEKKQNTMRALGKTVGLMIFLVAAFFIGFGVRGLLHGSDSHADEGHVQEGKNEEAATIWTCSMHPQIRQEKPGKCPLCFMDLIPLEEGDVGDLQIQLSEAAAKLMEVETSPAERKYVTAEIRMAGKIDYDETRVKYITSWVSGRIDRLYVDYTGIEVRKGDHMVYLYSPQLLSAQAELLQAAKAAENVKPDGSQLVSRSIQATLEAAREKLRLLGLKKEQIDNIEKTGDAVDHLTIYAPIGGVVIAKNVAEGAYVDTGTKIYQIADLSQLWVKLDAYESDMMWIRYGQEVEFTTEAYPGEVFKGRITFIDRVLNAETRTIKLRVNVDNPDGRLKPEMFVRAVVRSKLATAGRVMDEDLAGKWVCPMHPDIVKDGEGICDICEMPLEPSESLHAVQTESPNEPPLVIPASAPLLTGKRAVVYVKVPNTEKPTYEGREVVLGPRAGDHYIVKHGLRDGEVVVTNGSFKIDSEMQLRAMPSMMSVTSEGSGHDHGAAGEQKICPVMGGVINKEVFTEYKGKKVYFCCPGCIDMFKAAPEKYVGKLPQFRE
jgi:Cu(I)/Ag(I) efflux system membrane fusion protein